MTNLNIYQVAFDTILLSVLAESREDLYKILKEDSDNFIVDDGKIKYKWDREAYAETCSVEMIPFKRGIFHYESH